MRRLNWPVPPRWYQVCTYTGLAIVTASAVGYGMGALSGNDAVISVASCGGLGGFAVLTGSIVAVYSEREPADEWERLPQPPRTPSTADSLPGMTVFELDHPRYTVEMYPQAQRWIASIERQFYVPFDKLRQLAALLLLGRKVVYRSVSPGIITREQWDTFYPALVSSGWVVMRGKSITGLTERGRYMLECIKSGTPPQAKPPAHDQTQPVRTHARGAQV